MTIPTHGACLNCYRRSTYLRACLVCSSHPRHRVRDLSPRQRARTASSPAVRHVYGRLVWGLR